MKELPNPFWALLFVAIGAALVGLALFHKTEAAVVTSVITVGSNIVAGAFGFVTGHAAGVSAASTFPDQPKK